ncbi:MAG: CatB-related O-acetyltransferase [Selenomonadaceae bacterium]|nr:CatB-related O-acetyltransferase [Selenomonadaceae bacterium]
MLWGGGISFNDVIDGRIFCIPGFDFQRFCLEGKVYGKINDRNFSDITFSLYPRNYIFNRVNISLGIKSYIANAMIDGNGLIQIGNFSAIAGNISFELGLNNDHNHNNVSIYGLTHLDWNVPKDFYSKYKSLYSIINIGSDVWVGNGCKFKSSNPDSPLYIGNGSIIASNSVVVKDVPPFAIVGGNPAKIIKYRFDEKIVEALQRIVWWNWDIEKIYENFHLFNDPENFIRQFDHNY